MCWVGGWLCPAAVPTSHTGGCLPVGAQVPEDCICPLTLEVMRDPVIDALGHSYERFAMTAWLENHTTSPRASPRFCGCVSLLVGSTLAEIERFIRAERISVDFFRSLVGAHDSTAPAVSCPDDECALMTGRYQRGPAAPHPTAGARRFCYGFFGPNEVYAAPAA